MTLATRCSACGTSFRVVQDQLKVSGGWVRCGRCSEVFNAIEGLYEVGSPLAEPRVVKSPPMVAPAAAREPAEPPAPIGDLPAWPDDTATPPSAEDPAPPSIEDLRPEPEPTPEPEPEPEPEPQAEAEPEPEPVAVQIQAPEPATEVVAVAADVSPVHEHPTADDWRTPAWGTEGATPSFLREAERAERWQRPRVRAGLGIAAVLLSALLGLQAALAYRDILATRWPAARAPLQQACDWLGCRIEPLRHIAALSVDASGLQQVGTAAVYKLSVVIRNRSAQELMAPSLDLVLSDSVGATVARRVMSLSDLGRPAPVIGPGAEWAGQAVLDTGDRRVSGYTIEIFYP